MKSNTTLFAAGVFVVIVILAGVAYFATSHTAVTPSTNDESLAVPQNGTTTPNYTVELESSTSLKDIAPSLDRGVHFGASVPADARVILENKVSAVAARLKGDLTRADDWFSLALLYHSANDFEGARDVWLFLTKVIAAPSNATAYDNLGKLYKFDLKDFPKSEMYFKKSIASAPESITPYLELHELYRYSYKIETSAAADILISASKKFPTDPDPMALLGEYYRDKGETAKARSAFTTALSLARAVGNESQAKAIGDEIAKLPE